MLLLGDTENGDEVVDATVEANVCLAADIDRIVVNAAARRERSNNPKPLILLEISISLLWATPGIEWD